MSYLNTCFWSVGKKWSLSVRWRLKMNMCTWRFMRVHLGGAVLVPGGCVSDVRRVGKCYNFPISHQMSSLLKWQPLSWLQPEVGDEPDNQHKSQLVAASKLQDSFKLLYYTSTHSPILLMELWSTPICCLTQKKLFFWMFAIWTW